MSNSGDLQGSIEAVQSALQPLNAGGFSEKINRVSTYIGSIGRSWKAYASSAESARQPSSGDQDKYRKAVEARIKGLKVSVESSVKFARMNLDAAMDQALDEIIHRPRGASKLDEGKKIKAFQSWFDDLPDPTSAMLEHFKGSSNTLDKYLVAGPWGHQYLRKRHITSEAYDRELCQALSCPDSPASRVVLSYGRLSRAIDAVEEAASKMLESIGR